MRGFFIFKKFEKKLLQNKIYFVIKSSLEDYACIAQLVEQLTLNQWVRGSSPRARTNKKAAIEGGFFIG